MNDEYLKLADKIDELRTSTKKDINGVVTRLESKIEALETEIEALRDIARGYEASLKGIKWIIGAFAAVLGFITMNLDRIERFFSK